MLARSLATAALLLAVASELTTAAENEPVKSAETATTVKNETFVPATENSGVAVSRPVESTRAESSRAAPRSTRILFITAKDCEQCALELARLRRPGGEFEAMQSRGWKIGESPDNHLQIVDREAVAELVVQLHVREYPTVACISNGEIVRSFKDGCSTPLDAWTFGWLLKGESERPQAVIPEPIRVKSTGSYRLRGNDWSVEGDWKVRRPRGLSPTTPA